MLISHIYITQESRKKKPKKNHLRLLSSGTKLFITFWVKVFRHKEEGGTIFLWRRFHLPPSPATRAALVAHKFVWPRPGLNLNSLTFLKSQPMLPVRDVTYITGYILYMGFLLRHLWMTRPLCMRVNTCAHVCTKITHTLSRKVLTLTTPKGKI